MANYTYIIHFTNFTSGTLGGREDGYPFNDKIEFTDVEKFLKSRGNRRDETYSIEERRTLSPQEASDHILEAKKAMLEREEQVKRGQMLLERDKLQSRIDEINKELAE